MEQAALWNGPGASPWVRMQTTLDTMFAAVADLLVERVAAAVGTEAPTVLDVGCGTGATTLALAGRLGPGARCRGVDVSAPMIELARRRAADAGSAAEFVVADAGEHAFEQAAADVVSSRFGVMFFGDPVAAFGNLRAATRPGGALRAVVWRPAAENPFMTRAEESVAPLLTVAPRPSEGPGQFALADPERSADLLAEAGWSQAEAEPVDLPCTFPAAQLDAYLGSMGGVGLELGNHDDAMRSRVVEHLRPAFAEFLDGDQVRFTAACWLLAATAG